MFFLRKHDEALEINSSIAIRASIFDVFEALALRSVHNRYSRAGWELTPFEDDPYRFELWDPAHPEEVYIVTQTLCEPYHSYIMTIDYPPGLYENFLIDTTYFYQLKRLSEELTKVSCRQRFRAVPFPMSKLDQITTSVQDTTERELLALKDLIEDEDYASRSSKNVSKLSA